MNDYAILVQPGFGRADEDAAQRLCLDEFAALARLLERAVDGIEYGTTGGVPHVAFRCDGPLSPADCVLLRRLSFHYALFESGDWGGRRALLPVEPIEGPYFPAHLGSLLKYAGKTNERFTRAMINLALSCCRTGWQGAPLLLDPMCGKGTTLFEALTDGMNVAGVEINRAWWQEARTYLLKFLERGRYKHRTAHETVPDSRGRKAGDVLLLTTANNRAAYDAGDTRALRLVHGDSRQTALFFKRASVDLLVCDLPYGVQHEGKGASGREDLAALLIQCLPGWATVMKPGGSAVLSFNDHTLPRAAVEEAFARHGFDVLHDPPYGGCPHRVDQGIRRDFVVAVKVGGAALV